MIGEYVFMFRFMIVSKMEVLNMWNVLMFKVLKFFVLLCFMLVGMEVELVVMCEIE